uniref:Protein farnesyltransferase alpha subunit n=1 Tax=Solanum tuberosum TaxID=4113 RepID=M1A6Q1_SOLTU
MCSSSSSLSLESELMKHSRALLILSCDFGTAWNSRKLVLSKKQSLSMFMNELIFSSVILSHSPKSEQAWSQRLHTSLFICKFFFDIDLVYMVIAH